MVEQRQGPMVKKHCYNNFLMKFCFGEEKMKIREDQRMVKLYFVFFQNYPFWIYIYIYIYIYIFFWTSDRGDIWT
jgi:hypothetical protein